MEEPGGAAHRSVTYKQPLTPNLQSFAYPQMNVVAAVGQSTQREPIHMDTLRRKSPPRSPWDLPAMRWQHANNRATLKLELLKGHNFTKAWTYFSEVTQRSAPFAVLNYLHFQSSLYSFPVFRFPVVCQTSKIKYTLKPVYLKAIHTLIFIRLHFKERIICTFIIPKFPIYPLIPLKALITCIKAYSLE